MEEDVMSALKFRATYLPGGQDRDGRTLIVVNIVNDFDLSNVKILQTSINYIKKSLRDKNFKNELTVVVDAQKCPNRITKNHAKIISSLFGSDVIVTMFLVRLEGFWEKHVDHCTKSYAKGEPIFISKSRLQKYFEIIELPEELGGTLVYDHDLWIQKRVKIEEFREKFNKVFNEMENFHMSLLDHKVIKPSEADSALKLCAHFYTNVQMIVNSVIEIGNQLLIKLTDQNQMQPTIDNYKNLPNTTTTSDCNGTITINSNFLKIPQDLLSEKSRIQEMLNEIEKKQSEITNEWNNLGKYIQDSRELLTLEEGVAFVANWILGTAEQMLNKQQRIGCDVATSEELRRDHEELEMKCVETYGFYAELLYRIDSYSSDKESIAFKDLSSQRDFMDFVCRIFASRIERRRNSLITALRFFRLVSEYFDKTSEVFESLVMGNKVDDFTTAARNLRKLKESQQCLEIVEKELIKEGEKLSDILSMPVKDALGRDLNIDYSDDIANIRDIMDATIARRNIFIDSVELQKLTLEQVHHIHTYEEDAKMAINWMDDLYNVMIKCHSHVGCNVHEIQVQKDELQSFQETGKSIYNYGCQLLDASQSLRQSCKLNTEIPSGMVAQFRCTWHNLQAISQEHMVRLRVSAVFHRSVEEYCTKLHDLKLAVIGLSEIEESQRRRLKLRKYLAIRERLLVEVGRMVRLGRLLKTRLKEPFLLDDMNSTNISSPTTENPDASIEIISSNISLCSDSTTKETFESTLLGSSSSSTSTNNVISIVNPTGNNALACDAINNKLTNISEVAENLDAELRDTQNGLELVETNSSSSEKKCDYNRSSSLEDWNSSTRSTEDESFLTASEGHFTPHSRSSSFQTASEARTSPYWHFDKSACSLDVTDDGEEIPEIDLDMSLFPLQITNNANRIATLSANASFDSSDHSFQSARQSNSNHSPASVQSIEMPLKIPNDYDNDNDENESKSKRCETPTPNSKNFMHASLEIIEAIEIGGKHIDEANKVRICEINQNVAWENRKYYRSSDAKQVIKGCL